MAAQAIYLPPEIISLVLSFVQDLPEANETLTSCCLVSHEWWSMAAPILYEKPKIPPKHYTTFTTILTSNDPLYAPKGELGQHVRRLDLSELVYHSTNSLTARLLRSVRQGLQVFIAPAYSISSINLPSVAKCQKLRILDLSLVVTELTLSEIKTATKSISSLTTLRLPRETSLTLSSNDIPWPPNLTTLQFGGDDPADIPDFSKSFSWPEKLSSLTLHGCKRLTLDSIFAIFENDLFRQNLRRLRITDDNYKLHFRIMADFLPLVPKLTFLSLPGSDINSTTIPAMETLDMKLDLEILELGKSFSTWVFPHSALTRAFEGALHKLRRIGFHEIHWSSEYADLDQVLMANAKRAGYDERKLDSGEISTGCYVFP
ncbi:hypothetical protein LOZ36_004253 [Ophidiomyces ophidiicola]|nr:hypothetical protein LOZ36_004253 [Ophidiomyces ophidiicola]